MDASMPQAVFNSREVLNYSSYLRTQESMLLRVRDICVRGYDKKSISCRKWLSIFRVQMLLLLLCISTPFSQTHAQGNAAAVAASSAPASVTNQTTSAASVTPFYEKTGTSQTATAPKIGGGAHLLNVTLGLLAIIGLIFALSLFVKRFGTGSFAGNGQLKILSSLPLGTRERIVLVDVAGQQLLLGITPTAINTLHVFAEPVVVNNQTAAPSDFSQKLMAILQQKTVARTANNNNSAAQE